MGTYTLKRSPPLVRIHPFGGEVPYAFHSQPFDRLGIIRSKTQELPEGFRLRLSLRAGDVERIFLQLCGMNFAFPIL